MARQGALGQWARGIVGWGEEHGAILQGFGVEGLHELPLQERVEGHLARQGEGGAAIEVLSQTRGREWGVCPVGG